MPITHYKEFMNEVAKEAIADCEKLKDSLDELIYMCVSTYSNLVNPTEYKTKKEEEYFIRYKTMKQYIVENFGKR